MFSSLRYFQLEFDDLYFMCKDCIFSLVACPECVLIKRVRNIKYLGIVMDENGNWKEHLKN